MRKIFVMAAAVLMAAAVHPLVPNAISGQAPSAPPPFVPPTLAPSVQAMALPEKAAILAVVEGFLRSQDFSDAAALDAVFHADARGWSETNGEAEHEP
jgi:hypothetical protein